MSRIGDLGRPAKTTRVDPRRENLRTTLELVSTGASSRAEIARRTGLSRTAVSSLVGELLTRRLLLEVGQGESAGGKPPTLLALNGSGRSIAVLNLGNHPFEAALIDLDGNLTARSQGPSDSGQPAGDEALDLAIKMIETTIAKASSPLLGIGVGSPGVITTHGRVLEAANLSWHGLELARALEGRFDHPITVANDAAMAAFAEHRRHPEERDLILIKVGRGVGAGLVIDGSLYRGAHAAAGEIGHVRSTFAADPCNCGRMGCLETVASVRSILKAMGADPDVDPWDATILAERHGEENVQGRLSHAGRAIGAALAPVVATIDIGHVMIALELKGAGPTIASAVGEELGARVLPDIANLIHVGHTEAGSDLVLKGAAAAVVAERLGAVL